MFFGSRGLSRVLLTFLILPSATGARAFISAAGKPQSFARLASRMAYTGGKVAIVTGSNQGIGLEILKLISPQVDVAVLATRSPEKGQETAKTLREQGFSNVVFKPLDLASSEIIAAFASNIQEEYSKVDVLVNNAGTAFKDSDPTPFREQAEPTLKVNYFKTVELTEKLLPLLRKAEAPRVVNVASQAGHLSILKGDPSKQAEFSSPELSKDRLMELMKEFQADVKAGQHSVKRWPGTCYGISKLGLIAYSKIMAREEESAFERAAAKAEEEEDERMRKNKPANREEEEEVQPTTPPYKKVFFASCCPGWCSTSMSSYSGPRSPEEGARTPAWLALGGGKTPGGFYYDQKEVVW